MSCCLCCAVGVVTFDGIELGCLFLFPFLLRYLLELKKEHRAEFLRKVTGMAERIGFKVHTSEDVHYYCCIHTV